MESGKVKFRFSKKIILLPIIFFLFYSVYLFVFAQAFDIIGLALGAILGIILCSFFTKTYENYWQAVIYGITTPLSGTVVIILFIVGLFSAMMKSTGIANGFAWLGYNAGLSSSLFCGFTFLAASLIAVSTGSSIGTLFTATPILYPAGVLLGADPTMLAAAVLSGAVFGDNIAPVSDVTILSVSTQFYKNSQKTADIGGAVKARAPFAIVAGIIALALFSILGGGDSTASFVIQDDLKPNGLIMLIPVAILLAVSIKTRNIFKAIIWGTLTGTIIALLASLIQPKDIFNVVDGHVEGFLVSGFKGIIETVVLCLSLFGIMGIMEKSGFFEDLLSLFKKGDILKSPIKSELMIALGTMLFTIAFAGVTSASVIMFGPTANYVGQAINIHPYRRAYLLSGFANSIPVILPFAAFNFIAVIVANQSSDVLGVSITPVGLMLSSFYPIILFVIFLISIITGYGRIKEEN